MQRAESSRVHHLTVEMPTPPKKVILSVTKNKVQLNKMLIDGLMDEDFYKEATQTNMLVIAGHEDTPIQFIRGSVIRDQGLTSSHEEADTIIAQHAIFSCKAGETVYVIADDTDIFVLLTHFYYVE